MAFVHGSVTNVSLDGDDLSAYTNNSSVEVSVDSHDVTTYGQTAHIFRGGLRNGTATISGIYDNTAMTGPRAVIKPLLGTVVELIHQPEGTGAGRPQDTVDVLVMKYVQTHPVADMVTWSVELQFSGAVDATAQPA